MPLSPQQKKHLSLKKDCRNCYGENDKSSRTAIRARKRWVNRSYRRTVQQHLQHIDASTDDRVVEIQRKQWRKVADQPLGEMLLIHRQREIEYQIWQLYQHDQQLYEHLSDFLKQQNLTDSHYHIMSRRALDCMLNRNIFGLSLAMQDLEILQKFLKDYDLKQKVY